MAAKRSRTEAILEALMLLMDAIDQAIASLKAQPSSLGGIRVIRRIGPGRVGVPPREAFPLVPKRVRRHRKGNGAAEGQAEATPEQVLYLADQPLLQSVVCASPVVGARQPSSDYMAQVVTQTTTQGVVVGPVGTVVDKDTSGSICGETSQWHLVGHFASLLPWLSEVGMLPTVLVGGPLAGTSEGDVMERARCLVSQRKR
ncbi:hypothetical protein NDU88_005481 [Pleurodeles waltl]|uniref:Uncharacterized protein n=1 Tax=Pleurodeles waltl TaxID=8319 RepID=A0AAV7QHB0_PLEWA|nr:hypothetical protein NDU88_005481 [Pleurodeles waltl]